MAVPIRARNAMRYGKEHELKRSFCVLPHEPLRPVRCCLLT